MTQKLNELFLIDLFKYLLLNKRNFETVLPFLKDSYLPEEFAGIWSSARKYYYEKGNAPAIHLLIQKLQQGKTKNTKDLPAQLELLGEIRIREIEYEDTELLHTFEEFIRQAKFHDLHEKLADLYNEGKREDAYGLLQKGSEDIRNFSLSEGKFERVFGDFQRRSLRRLADGTGKAYQIPVGIDPIDRDSEGGFFTGETELWLGDSGMGKSKLLVTRAVNSARRGFNVLHIQAEGTEEQCMANYDANWGGMRYMDIRLNRIDADMISQRNKVAKHITDVVKGEIFVKCKERFGSISVQEIRRWALELFAQGIEIHHIVIDYFDLIAIDGMNFSYENGEVQRQIILGRMLKDLSVELNCLVTTATQSTGVPFDLIKQEDFVLTRFNLGQSKRKFEAFSYFFTINRTPDEAQEQICRIYADKYRELKSGQTYRIAQNLGYSRFYDRKRTAQLILDDEEE
jgi:hypothetical protein